MLVPQGIILLSFRFLAITVENKFLFMEVRKPISFFFVSAPPSENPMIWSRGHIRLGQSAVRILFHNLRKF